MLIPSNIRERFNISPNDKVTIELTEDALIIRNVDYIINDKYKLNEGDYVYLKK
jgi:AbrB family looped-hinge helix DNA binding protein